MEFLAGGCVPHAWNNFLQVSLGLLWGRPRGLLGPAVFARALAVESSSLCCSLSWHASECGLLWANRGHQNNSQACLVSYWPLDAAALGAVRKREFSTTGVLVTNYYRGGTSSPSSRATSFAELWRIRT